MNYNICAVVPLSGAFCILHPCFNAAKILISGGLNPLLEPSLGGQKNCTSLAFPVLSIAWNFQAADFGC